MRHIFITGEIQTGKSTAINRALADSDLILGGYRTVGGIRREDGNSYVHLLRADTYEQLAPHNRALHRKPTYGRIHFEINKDVYNTKGVHLLRHLPEGCQLILMDEIGKREKHCASFRKAIFETLDGEIPVLGVVQIRPDDFLDRIRKHPNVDLIHLTKENRDQVAAYLKKRLSEL